MPRLPPLLGLVFTLAALLPGGPATATPAAATASDDIFAANRRLGRGVNIIGYDPLWRDPAQARFHDRHFRALKAAGFQAVRLNLHPFRFLRAENDWRLPASWWRTLDWALDQAQANGLVAIVDLHEFNAIGENVAAGHAPFLAFWRQIAAHLRHAPDSVYFEILNEPCKQLTPALWNTWLAEALAIIRATHPHRPVIVGPAQWNAIKALPELALPPADRHLIVTVHYYDPMEFTHQGAAWSSHREKSGITWRGTAEEQDKIERDFARAAAWAQTHQRPLFLGEFGAYDRAPLDSRVRYTAAVARTAEKFGWAWAYWQFDSDFLLWDMQNDRWVEPIRDALIPRPTAPATGTP